MKIHTNILFMFIFMLTGLFSLMVSSATFAQQNGGTAIEVNRPPEEATPVDVLVDDAIPSSEGDVVELEELLQIPGLEQPTEEPGPDFDPEMSYHYFYVPGSELQPQSSSSGYAYDGYGCIHRTSGSDSFITELSIPDSATIMYLRLFFHDTSASNMTASITKHGGSGAGTAPPVTSTLVTVTSSGAAGYGTALSAALTHDVDFYNWAYILTWNPVASSNTLRLCGLKVTYYE